MADEYVIIYTDGACDPNPGPGGWAAILRYGQHEKVLSGGKPQTTNNRMELRAALSALQALKRGCHITLYTDSEYVRQGITNWLPSWQENGWRTRQRSPVQNQDLWEALANEIRRHKVEWRWVRGHAGNPLNERVDGLARAAIPRPDAPNKESERDSQQSLNVIHIFTRASCLGSPGTGGWAVVMRKGDEITSLSGSSTETTANALELQAAINALTVLQPPSQIRLYTVSKYLHQGITRWMDNWRQRDWQTREGKPVRHKALWLKLQELIDQHQVEWHLLSPDDRPQESEQAATLAAEAARVAQADHSSEAE
jgi:ribonuclease HI